MSLNACADELWRNPGNPNSLYNSGPGMDTWFGTTFNTTAQHDSRLRIGGWGDAYYTLLRFDLSGLPQFATTANIWLAPINEGAPTPINWYGIGSQWHSSTVTRDNFPYASLVSLFSTPNPTQGFWYVVDITSSYNQWRVGTGPLNYGFLLAPVQNNNNFSTFTSSTPADSLGPWLQVIYDPQVNDSVLKLKWPLATPRSSLSVTLPFGGQSTITCSDGSAKEHNGVDYSATAETAVYAAEDGIVQEVFDDGSDGWASNIVIEHNHPQGGKYTTVYWHVNPVPDVIPSGGFVPKGMQIATVADLTQFRPIFNHGTHFHFGVRIGTYILNVSGVGALPFATHPCGAFPVFPAGFINPEDVAQVIFQ
jgi:murein DD-endopeptidase MepM/ murein hydrolase activator NlpD